MISKARWRVIDLAFCFLLKIMHVIILQHKTLALVTRITLNLILLFNFALTPIHDRYMPAWKGKYASLDYALTNKMSNIKGHLLNLLWLKTFKMIKRKCKITHAQRKDIVEYFPEWHAHINTSVALKLTLYAIIFTYKNMLSKYLSPDFLIWYMAILHINML